MGAFLVCLLLGAFGLFAIPASAAPETRIALVIGNSAYEQTPPLANPKNDAQDVAAALSAVGFKVTLKLDANKAAMDRALDDFERAMQSADTVLFYYAGHALQREGENFLMPVDAKLEDKFSLKRELTKVADVRDALGSCGKCVRIVVLDACRNNPLAARLDGGRDVGGASRGLASFEKPQGMIVAFATQAGQIAQDGDGRNSPFTRALLDEIGKPEVEIAELFRNVALDVRTRTQGKQEPEIAISGIPRFFLNQNEGDVTAFEKLDFADRAQLQAFLQRFPGSAKRPFVEKMLKVIDDRGVVAAGSPVNLPDAPPAAVVAKGPPAAAPAPIASASLPPVAVAPANAGPTASATAPVSPIAPPVVAMGSIAPAEVDRQAATDAEQRQARDVAAACGRERQQLGTFKSRRRSMADERARRALQTAVKRFDQTLVCAALHEQVAGELATLATAPLRPRPVANTAPSVPRRPARRPQWDPYAAPSESAGEGSGAGGGGGGGGY